MVTPDGSGLARGASAVGTPRTAARSRGKLTDGIIESLRQDIVTGRLKAGERLPNERDLAMQFGVSQPTIREAVRALDVLGLVDVRHGSGAYVQRERARRVLMATALPTLLQIEGVSIIEALDVRELLGRETARIAATVATDEDLAVLRERLAAIDAMDARLTVDDIAEHFVGFQIAVSAAAHHPLLFALEAFLINLLMQLQMKTLRKRGAKHWLKRSRDFQNDRHRLVEAIESRVGDRAYEAMEHYLGHQRQTLLSDPEVQAMRLSDPKAVRAVADIVSGVGV